MFSLLHKEENAHEDGIWTVSYGRATISEDNNNRTDIEATSPRRDESDGSKKNSETLDFIVTGGLDDLVKVWDVGEEGVRLRHAMRGHSLGVVSVAVSSDGKTVASTSLDSSLCFWDPVSGTQRHMVTFGPVDLWTVAFSPCNKYVISGSNDGKISMFNVESGKSEQVLDPQNGKFTLSIAYSPDGRYIASGAIDGIITIFDVSAGKVVQTLEGHAMSVRSLCFSPNSEMLLTASDDGHMKLYDVAHSDVAGTLSGHSSWVLCVSFSDDGKHFASSSSDNTVKIWDFAERKCMHTFSEHYDQVWGVKYSPSNDKVISVGEDKNLNIYNCPPNVVV